MLALMAAKTGMNPVLSLAKTRTATTDLFSHVAQTSANTLAVNVAGNAAYRGIRATFIVDNSVDNEAKVRLTARVTTASL